MGLYNRISQLIDGVRKESGTAEAHVDLDVCTITLRFELQGERGFLMLKPRDRSDPYSVVRRKLRAAAYSEMRGTRPRNLRDAMAAIRKVHPNAIKILTNIDDLEVIACEWDTLSYGISKG